MILRYCLFSIFLFQSVCLFAYDDIKVRLPQSVNSFQPVIVPVTNFEESILFFDRKFFPENAGGVYDKDDIWYSQKIAENVWSQPRNIGKPLNTKYSDVLFSMSPDGRDCLLYGIYTKDGKKDGFSITEFDGENFSQPKALNIKNFYNDSSVYFGYLSPDKAILLMSLGRKDSQGDMDLYVSFYDEKSNSYSEPKNLGTGINSEYAETSPFLAYNNKTLYFASKINSLSNDYDIYMTERLDDTWQKWSAPKSLGRAINSNQDENSFYLNAMGNSAYIVSWDNETKRKGIYKVILPDSLSAKNYFYLKGTIKSDSDSLINQEITLNIKGTSKKFTYHTNNKGEFLLPLESNGKYTISLLSNDFETEEFVIDSDTIIHPVVIQHDFVLKEIMKNVPFNIQESIFIIYYENNKSDISENDKSTLLSVLENFPKEIINIKIFGYACEVGSDEHNRKLSESRAVKVKDFLIEMGYSGKNISVIPIGESRKEEKLELNRKSEIIITPLLEGR